MCGQVPPESSHYCTEGRICLHHGHRSQMRRHSLDHTLYRPAAHNTPTISVSAEVWVRV